MRGIEMKFASMGAARAALAIALATGVAAGGIVLGAAPALAAAKEKPAAKINNSPEFVKLAGPFQKSFGELEAKKGKVSAEELKAAALLLVPQLAAMESSVKNPADRITWGQWQQLIGGMTNDKLLTIKGLQNMYDSGQLAPAMVTTVAFFIGYTAYQINDYATTIKTLPPVVAGNYKEDAAASVLADAYDKSGQPAQALETFKIAIAAKKAAGGTPPEDWYAQAVRTAARGKLNKESLDWAIQQVQAYPNATNWLAAGQLINYTMTTFQTQDTLDVERLLERTGAFEADPKYVGREYVTYIEAADFRRSPGEVLRIAEKGIAAGLLKSSDIMVSEAVNGARARVAADKASLAGAATESAKAANGTSAAATADAYLSYGDAAKAEELYKLALSKGGVDANKDRILTRIGIAQIDGGKYAEAKATLAQVTGQRTQLAALWAIYADQKAAGK